MRILIAVISYRFLTGAEMYCYELARELTRRGHTVAITAPRVGGELSDRTRSQGIEVFALQDCPPEWAPDVLHVNEFVPSVFACALYPHTPAIATVHSEYDCERPFVSPRIWRYVHIRPSIKAVLVERYGIAPERASLVYNGVDARRFAAVRRAAAAQAVPRVLFVGTIDPLRRRAIEDLIAKGAREGFKVRVVGTRHADYLDRPPAHVEVFPSTWQIEQHLASATATAGVLLGRTTIEGWFAGLPGWIYDIDLEGRVTSRELFAPPEDLGKFAIENVATELLALYEQAAASGYMGDERIVQECLSVAAAVSIGQSTAAAIDVGSMRDKVAAFRARYARPLALADSARSGAAWIAGRCRR